MSGDGVPVAGPEGVMVVVGAGGMGAAIARRSGPGRHVVLADHSERVLRTAAESMPADVASVRTHPVDVTERPSVRDLAERAARLGPVTTVVHTAGLSPAQAGRNAIVAVDLVGTALVLDELGAVCASGATGVAVASMAGHQPGVATRSPDPEVWRRLSTAPAEELATLVPDDLAGADLYAWCKHANIVRVRHEAAGTWARRGARLNSLSPGVVATAMAAAEQEVAGDALTAIALHAPAGRVGTTGDVAAAAAFLLGAESAYVCGTDLLVDGGATAAMLCEASPGDAPPG